MNDFVQMDIFFFIASVAVVIFLLFVVVIGVYVVHIVKNLKAVSKDLQDLAVYARSEGRKTVTEVRDKVDQVLNGGSFIEKTVVSTLGTIIAKTFKSRGKIKKEVPKKK